MSLLDEILARIEKAEKFLNGDAPDEKKEKWLPEFMKLLDKLKELLK